jgi:hypothetical protein
MEHSKKSNNEKPIFLVRLVEEGGDWDRRTRLKDYEAYYLVTHRKFQEVLHYYPTPKTKQKTH